MAALRPLLLLCCCFLAAVSRVQAMMNFDKILTMYAYRLVSEACVGERIASQWNKAGQDARYECAGSVQRELDRQYPAAGSSTPTTTPYSFDNGQPVMSYATARIKQLDMMVIRKNAMINCTLIKLNVINEKGDLRTADLLQQFQDLSVVDDLKQEMVGGVRECINMASCLSMPDHSGLAPSLKRALVYGACEKKRRALACIRRDLREKAALFELAGLEGVSALTATDGSRSDNTDAMLMLLWSDAHDSDDMFGLLGQ